MSVVTLPAGPYPVDGLDWKMDRRGGVMTPLGAGVAPHVLRVGDKMAVTGQLGMMARDCARGWVAALLSASLGDTVRWTLPGYGLAAGTPLVKGGDQLGSTLDVDGLPAGLVIPAATPFNVHDATGRPYLHFTRTSVTANGSGEATLSFAPMLRISPADNSAVELAAPKIEGWLNDGGAEWSVERLEFHMVPFGIVEAR